MVLQVNWLTRVITIPKADLTLISAGPPEVRQLDINAFRLELKALMDDPVGMPFPDTHAHNTEVTISGITLARVFRIINGYTITFEDGQYAVNLAGANSNISDVANVNQVSIRAFNSAGLTSPGTSAAAVANAVWSEDPAPYLPGSAGEILVQIASDAGQAATDAGTASTNASAAAASSSAAAASASAAAASADKAVDHHEGRYPIRIDPVTSELVWYDLDGTTELRRAPLTDRDGGAVTLQKGQQAARGVPV